MAAGSPASSGTVDTPRPETTADWQDKVLHARIEIGGTVLMGADVARAEPMRSAYLSLTLDREVDAERTYALLADGGEGLHEDGEDAVRQSLCHAQGQVRDVVDAAAPARGGLVDTMNTDVILRRTAGGAERSR